MSCDIGVGTAGHVEVLGVGWVGLGGEPRADRLLLPRRAREEVGEPAAGEGDDLLRGNVAGAADDGDPWAGSGEGRCVEQLGRVGLRAVGAGAGVTAGGEDGDTTSSDLGEEVADGVCVRGGDTPLVVSVGDGDGLGDLVHGQEVGEELEVRLVVELVVDRLRGTSASRKVDGWGWVGESESVLDVEICLDFVLGTSSRILQVQATVNQDLGEVSTNRIRLVLGQELGKIIVLRVLLEETSESELVAVAAGSTEVLELVESLETVDGDGGVASNGVKTIVDISSSADSCDARRGGHVLDDCGHLGCWAGELDGWRNNVDIFVQSSWETVLERASSLLASGRVLEDLVLGVKESLDGADSSLNNDPIASSGGLGREIVGVEPLHDLGEGVTRRCKHSLDLVLGGMSAIAGVVGGSGIEDLLLEGLDVAVLEVDAQLEAQVRVYLRRVVLQSPWLRSSGQLFEHTVGSLAGSRGSSRKESNEGKLHGEGSSSVMS